EEVCSGLTGHAEVVLVVFDPNVVAYRELLAMFWEIHDPTQGMRQGNDIGTQYRSVIYTTSADQEAAAKESRDIYQEVLTAAGLGEITTEIAPLDTFYYAEPYHQQYLGKNPNGYDCHVTTGTPYPRDGRASAGTDASFNHVGGLVHVGQVHFNVGGDARPAEGS